MLFLGGCICTQAFNYFTTSASQLCFLPPSGAYTQHVCIHAISFHTMILQPGRMSPKLRWKQEQNLRQRGWVVSEKYTTLRLQSALRPSLPTHTENHCAMVYISGPNLSLLSSTLLFSAFYWIYILGQPTGTTTVLNLSFNQIIVLEISYLEMDLGRERCYLIVAFIVSFSSRLSCQVELQFSQYFAHFSVIYLSYDLFTNHSQLPPDCESL